MTASVAPKSRNSGSINAIPKAVKRTEVAAERKSACPSASSAWSLFRSPSLIEIMIVAPVPIVIAIAKKIKMTGNATVTAASPSVPKHCPTKTRATRL